MQVGQCGGVQRDFTNELAQRLDAIAGRLNTGGQEQEALRRSLDQLMASHGEQMDTLEEWQAVVELELADHARRLDAMEQAPPVPAPAHPPAPAPADMRPPRFSTAGTAIVGLYDGDVPDPWCLDELDTAYLEGMYDDYHSRGMRPGLAMTADRGGYLFQPQRAPRVPTRDGGYRTLKWQTFVNYLNRRLKQDGRPMVLPV